MLDTETDRAWTQEVYNRARKAGHCEECVYSLLCLSAGYIVRIQDTKHYIENSMLCQITRAEQALGDI